MKIIDAINKIDAMKPNVYPQEDKIAWLSALDGMIKRDVIDRHEGWEQVPFTGYDTSTPLDTEMIVGAPYEELYVTWLESKIDYANGEYVKYNNSITRFNDLYTNFDNDYNRNHMPLGKRIRYW